ncbi:EscU/YscU/HrcU family type III secretion system export apparatus switch protein [Thermoleophilum album]|uniref:Flagellar biosynthesis protein n=1 Tax=Thermoleophilum album TaxID=29539 RepID=A0A1H6FWB2_THEAL|nr:EscU/YscU/HrcU family type III secretion system export apparatus switch protein [Thermoleophilum album]SEH14722.1 flagellar biosynthesis protein [Thermoleophilum album]
MDSERRLGGGGRPKRAAALRYRAGEDAAPRVVATGSGKLAERIIEIAREAGVPVREDAALVDALSQLELGAEIPPELYAAVAELLVWAYGLDVSLRSPEDR